jgi:hypothetical protein
MVPIRSLKALRFVHVLALLTIITCGESSGSVQVSPQYVIVDNYAGDQTWNYSSMGTDRYPMGGGTYSVNLGGGQAQVSVTNGWAGVYTSLMHNTTDQDVLKPTQLLGPYVKAKYQPRIIGIEIDLSVGNGALQSS